MTSIRRKLFIQIGSLMLFFILLLFLANTFLLEIIYTNRLKADLIDIYEQVDALELDNYSGEELYDIVVGSGVFVELSITDMKTNTVYLPKNPFLDSRRIETEAFKANQLPKNEITIQKVDEIDDNSRFIWLDDPRNKMNFIIYESLLHNGFRIELRIPVNSIKGNVAFFNTFILICGLVVLLISSFVANWISKHFTKTIISMSEVTNHIKDLDFSATCQVTTNDEIGQLAQNINEMQQVLEENMTNLETSNEKLKEEVAERLKIDEQRKALLNNVSHELKTPLSLVQGYSEGLKVNLHKNPEKTDFYCDVIMDEAKKMDMLVSELLDINRIQFGDFPLHKEKLDAYELIHYVVKKYEEQFKAAEINLSLDLSLIEENQLAIDVDALRCEQIITNLLNNALAYVDNNRQIHISCGQETDHLVLKVANSHQMISEEELGSWWQSFYKADKARTRENGGYGLGLSFIKAVQEADHNNYNVEYLDGMVVFKVSFDIA